MDVLPVIELIETLNPANDAEMTEIDKQVWGYLYGNETVPPAAGYPRYTRSRDVLKIIRPTGFLVKIENWEVFTGVYGCFILPDGTLTEFDSGWGTTEEPADLHVILQGIAYNRKLLIIMTNFFVDNQWIGWFVDGQLSAC